MVVWVGSILIRETTVSPDGKELTFLAPSTKAGIQLDLGVGTLGKKEKPERRIVAKGAYKTGGVSAPWVAAIAVALAVLALLGTPLFVVIAMVTCLGLFLEAQLKPDLGFFTSGPKAGVGTNLYISWLGPMGDSPLFIAIPLFTFAGTLMSESQAPTRLINLCRALLGWLPGGLAVVTLTACCFFTAFTGASGVTIIALGGLLFPILLREKYPERFSLGLLTTGGSLGLLFPPSLPVIVYGLVARVDIGRLFVAAIIPGIILVGFLIVTSFAVAIKSKVPRHPFTFPELWEALKGAAWELPLPIIVVGGIYSGLVTAAEASALTAAYVLFTTVGVYKDVEFRDLLPVVKKTAVLVGAILMIMGAALGFTDWLTLERVPQRILEVMAGVTDWCTLVTGLPYQITFLIMLNIFLLIVGCMMDIFSATLVVVPLITPVAHEFGIDPYHLAVVFLVNLEIGYSTPPVGINLFIASLRFRRPVFALYRASILFIAVLMAALMLITYIPALSLGFFDNLPTVELQAPIGIDLERDGKTVRRVHAESWAAKNGIRKGDVFQELVLDPPTGAGTATTPTGAPRERRPLTKKSLRIELNGLEAPGTLIVKRAGRIVELKIDPAGRSAGKRLVLRAGEAGLLHAKAELGTADLSEALARRKRALAALRAAEKRLDANFDDLDEACKAAEEALDEAKGQDRVAAKELLEALKAKRAPLDPLDAEMSAARTLVDDLQGMDRTLKWRSRLDGETFMGPYVDLSKLAPGDYVLSATIEDKRRHVAQSVVRVKILPPEKGSERPKSTPKPSSTPGDEGGWGDDDDDDDDGAWGDDDDDDEKTAEDGSWGDDDDDDAKTEK
ncbi:MAG: TRAP transporter large permease [Planctomycetes bacterium]|nr:TRAP transporter large permease [Planctomycetota bacterium]